MEYKTTEAQRRAIAKYKKNATQYYVKFKPQNGCGYDSFFGK